jgi:CBS domain-containing protein
MIGRISDCAPEELLRPSDKLFLPVLDLIGMNIQSVVIVLPSSAPFADGNIPQKISLIIRDFLSNGWSPLLFTALFNDPLGGFMATPNLDLKARDLMHTRLVTVTREYSARDLSILIHTGTFSGMSVIEPGNLLIGMVN